MAPRHDWERQGQRWLCLRCHRTTKLLASQVGRGPCRPHGNKGPRKVEADQHDLVLVQYDPLRLGGRGRCRRQHYMSGILCRRCGGYAEARPRKLAGECLAPSVRSRRLVRELLGTGIRKASGARVLRVQPVTSLEQAVAELRARHAAGRDQAEDREEPCPRGR